MARVWWTMITTGADEIRISQDAEYEGVRAMGQFEAWGLRIRHLELM